MQHSAMPAQEAARSHAEHVTPSIAAYLGAIGQEVPAKLQVMTCTQYSQLDACLFSEAKFAGLI